MNNLNGYVKKKKMFDLVIIRKLFGEKMEHYCRDNFSTILEEEGLLSKLLLERFYDNHYLYQDILEQGKIQLFKNYIYSLVTKEDKKREFVDKSPEELMDMAGYVLKECITEEEIQEYIKYYAKGEELCTFLGNRLKKCRVFFAIRKNVDEIRRCDFKNPQRQDKYGTSVISIQFTRDSSNTLSIKNRYNQAVLNPDATFSNDLDNIISGLTLSFEKYYGLIQKCDNDDFEFLDNFRTNRGFELLDYVKANDGRRYKYNCEINNKYYCHDNIIIDNFEVVRFDKSRYLLVDYFLIDLLEKKIKFYDLDIQDSFASCVGDIKDIVIKNLEDGKNIVMYGVDGRILVIELNHYNSIIKLETYGITELPDYFLRRNVGLKVIRCYGLRSVGNEFLYSNNSLEEIDISDLERAGDSMLFNTSNITKIFFPNLLEVGEDFFYRANKLDEINLDNIKKVGTNFLANYVNRDKLLMDRGIVMEKGKGAIYR